MAVVKFRADAQPAKLVRLWIVRIAMIQMREHDEWTKILSDGRTVKYTYNGVADEWSASIEIGQYFKSSRTNVGRSLTRDRVEALFHREINVPER